MILKLSIALLLMAICVVVHSVGLAVAFRHVRRRTARLPAGFWAWSRLLVGVATLSILLHLLQIGVWGGWYALAGALPDLPTALYFSAVTYTTTGYGDIVLPEEWRLVGGVQALTGILMCGLSTGLFFAVSARGLGIGADAGSRPA